MKDTFNDQSDAIKGMLNSFGQQGYQSGELLRTTMKRFNEPETIDKDPGWLQWVKDQETLNSIIPINVDCSDLISKQSTTGMVYHKPVDQMLREMGYSEEKIAKAMHILSL